MWDQHQESIWWCQASFLCHHTIQSTGYVLWQREQLIDKGNRLYIFSIYPSLSDIQSNRIGKLPANPVTAGMEEMLTLVNLCTKN